MSQYFLRLAQDPCSLNFSSNSVRKLVEWNFTPNGSAVMNKLEVHSTRFLWAEGSDLINSSDGSLNGTLDLKFQCLDAKKGNFNKLSAIQIEGYAIGVNSWSSSSVVEAATVKSTNIEKTFYLPLGESIKIQLVGGIGSVRFANSSEKEVISLSKTSSFETANYKPELRGLNDTNEQINLGIVEVDRSLGSGAHIFTLTANQVGKSSVLFMDMASSRYYINFEVLPNLCKDQIKIINQLGEEFEENLDNRGNYNVESFGNDLDFDIAHEDYCDCNINSGTSVNGSVSVAVPDSSVIPVGAEIKSKIYDQEKFIAGTRSIDLNNLDRINENSLPIKPAKVYDLYVGERAKIKIPASVKENYEISIVEKNNESKNIFGAGWGANNTGPTWAAVNSEKSIVSVDNNTLLVTCKAPTNFLPALLYFKPKNHNRSIIRPLPARHKKIQLTSNHSSALLTYTQVDGTESSIEAVYENADEQIHMTNSDFFVAIRCFCKDVDLDTDTTKEAKEGETFDLSVDGEVLENAQKFYFDRDSISNQGSQRGSNIIVNPDSDGLSVSEGNTVKFKIAIPNRDRNIVYQNISTFFTHSSKFANASNIHKPAFEAFDDQVFEDGSFWEELDDNSKQEFRHNPSSLEYFPCWLSQGLTVQPRGTWCINHQTFNIYSKSEMPVVSQNGNPIGLKDSDSESFVVLKEEDKVKNYGIEY